MTPRVSFVILTYRRAALLRACLESLARSGAAETAEAWIGFNGQDQDTDALLAEVCARYPWARCVRLPKTGRSEARNALIPRARGEIVHFLDDDTVVPPDFISRLIEKFDRFPDAPVIGGPNVAPPGSPPFERAVDFLLRSRLGSGPMSVRYRPEGEDRKAPGWCFMLSNFGVRRRVVERHGLRFPARCASAEENLFLYEIERRAGSPVLSPSLFVFHHRRGTVASFCGQVFTNGRGRAQVTAAAPGSLQGVVLAPPLFFLYLAALPSLGRAAWLPAAAYAAACLAEAARLALVDPAAALRLAPLFPLAHASYAAGLLSGVFSGSCGSAIYADAAVERLRRVDPTDV